MFKRMFSLLLMLTVLAAMTLTSPGCQKKTQINVEEHEEENTERVLDTRQKVE
jgi:hypothetical protein